MTRSLLAALSLAATCALAEAPRYDHRGAVGLLLGGSGLDQELLTGLASPDRGWRGAVDLGTSISVGDSGNELLALARATLGGERVGWSVWGGYRGYFGKEQLKTFFDVQLSGHFGAAWAIGPRLGFGVQLDPLSTMGFYLGLGSEIGFGPTIRWSAGLIAGVQLRSYLLE